METTNFRRGGVVYLNGLGTRYERNASTRAMLLSPSSSCSSSHDCCPLSAKEDVCAYITQMSAFSKTEIHEEHTRVVAYSSLHMCGLRSHKEIGSIRTLRLTDDCDAVRKPSQLVERCNALELLLTKTNVPHRCKCREYRFSQSFPR